MFLRYIGNKPTKNDNVTNSGILWTGPGDVKKIPDERGILLLNHPNVWERVEQDDKGNWVRVAKDETESFDPVAAQARGSDIDKVIAAIGQLSDDDYSSTDSKPKVAALSKMAGFSVGAALRDKAWDQVLAAREAGNDLSDVARAVHAEE